MNSLGPHIKIDSYPWRYTIVSTVGKGCFYTGISSKLYSIQSWSISPSAAIWYDCKAEAARALFDLFASQTRGMPAKSLCLVKMPSILKEFTFNLSILNDQEIVEVQVRRPSFNRLFKREPSLLTTLLNTMMYVKNREYKYSPSFGLTMPKPFSVN